MKDRVVLVAMGASTPVGRDVWSSAAAVRAGISGFGQHPYMIDTAGEPMRVARAEWLDIGLTGLDRFEALLVPAIDQALEPLNAPSSTALNTALALALPSPRPGLPEKLQPDLMARLATRYRGRFGAAAAFPFGHAAGLLALDAAFRKIGRGGLDACVVAGVDTYLEPETLEWLEECDQLHGAGPLNNAWGFIPGEAAGAILLVRGEVMKSRRLEPLAQILGVATGFESKRIKTETVCIGEGLAQTFRGALVGLRDGIRVTDVYCDLNGEPYRADEYGFTCLRTKEHFEAAANVVVPADCWGDVCAASGPLYAGLSAIADRKGYANGSYALLWASSEDGQRGATLLGMIESR